MTFISDNIAQYRAEHGRLPETVFVSPLASLVLAKRSQLVSEVDGVRVCVKKIDKEDLARRGNSPTALGIVLFSHLEVDRLIAVHLK